MAPSLGTIDSKVYGTVECDAKVRNCHHYIHFFSPDLYAGHQFEQFDQIEEGFEAVTYSINLQ